MQHMKYKMLNRIMKVLEYVLIFVLVCCSIFILNGTIEKIFVNKEIRDFKERGEYVGTETINGQNVKMYLVKAKYDYEDVSRPSFNKVEKYGVIKYYLGSKADITITSRNPLRMVDSGLIRDIVGFFSNNFYIGHATINITDDGSKYIESVGNLGSNNGVLESYNSWVDTEIRGGDDTNRIVGLRLKNTTEEIRDNIAKEVQSKVGLEYNFNFFIPKKDKYYCTDLISRTTKKYGIDINYDGMFSIGNDIILSKNTYLIFYIDRVSRGNFEFYYLG